MGWLAALIRATGENWTCRLRETDALVQCSHRPPMKVYVAYPPGTEEPFHSPQDEQEFVKLTILNHQKDYVKR